MGIKACDHGYLHWGMCPTCNAAGMEATPIVQTPDFSTPDEDEDLGAQRKLLTAILAYAEFQKKRGITAPFVAAYDQERHRATLDQRIGPDLSVHAFMTPES